MKLTSITIKNFRGIEELTLGFDDLTVLIGENNTGKTSVLEAIKSCLGPDIRGRGQVFDPDDYRYINANSRPGDAGPISVELQFREALLGEWSVDLIQALTDVIVVDPASGLSSVSLRVTSLRSAAGNLETSWAFLNPQGQALAGPASQQSSLLLFHRITPWFMIQALRDADREFQAKSSFWGPFVRDINMSAAEIKDFEDTINDLNTKIVDGHETLKEVQVEVGRVSGIMGSGLSGDVSIDALPARLADIVSKSTVNMKTHCGAKLPLSRHGAGLQSLSVFLLFQAFVKSQLKKRYDELSTPVVAIEEPETHLHPSAARVFSASLTNIPGQKIVTSHSGEVVAGVPLGSIRRLYSRGGKIHVGQINPANYDDNQKRKIDFFVTATRGELLFANVWLLGEGETEYWLVNYAARTVGIDLELAGIRFVPYANCGVETMIAVANELGIRWVLLSDNDPAGQTCIGTAKGMLGGEPEQNHIVALPAGMNFEEYLIGMGYEAVYEARMGPQLLNPIAAHKGTPSYPAELAKKVNKQKIRCAMDVGEVWLSKQHVPILIGRAIHLAAKLGGA